MEYCATIPPELKIKGFHKKYLLKKAVTPLLPSQVISHKKQGFVGPMSWWLKRNLKEVSLDWLSERNLKRHDILNSKTINNILTEHFSGRENNDTLIWSLLVFQKWFDMYMGGKQ
jgi:asparagine synthase (glutamine-hydrolysing)